MISVLNPACCHCITGALSMTNSDDDYCVSYTVTMVDVRSCTRHPRILCPKSSIYIGNVYMYIAIYMYVSQ